MDFHLVQTDEVAEAPALALSQVLLDQVGGQRLPSFALLRNITHELHDHPKNG